MGGEEPQLENLLLTILAKAQGNEFWEKLDEVAANLCKLRNNWLDNYIFSPLLHLIVEIVVGQYDYDYDVQPYGYDYDVRPYEDDEC